MAKVYSYSDKYIERQAQKAGLLGFMFRYGNAILAGLASGFTTSQWQVSTATGARVAWFILWLLGYGLLFWWLSMLAARAKRRQKQFSAGGRGEAILVGSLKLLPDRYTIFYDIKLPAAGGNIDALIFGNQIFVVESKHHSGEIKVTSTGMVRAGKPVLGRNPISQARSAARALQHYLDTRGVKNIPLQPVLVFTNKYARLSEKVFEVEGVFVVSVQDLPWFLASKSRKSEPNLKVIAAIAQIRAALGAGSSI